MLGRGMLFPNTVHTRDKTYYFTAKIHKSIPITFGTKFRSVDVQDITSFQKQKKK